MASKRTAQWRFSRMDLSLYLPAEALSRIVRSLGLRSKGANRSVFISCLGQSAVQHGRQVQTGHETYFCGTTMVQPLVRSHTQTHVPRTIGPVRKAGNGRGRMHALQQATFSVAPRHSFLRSKTRQGAPKRLSQNLPSPTVLGSFKMLQLPQNHKE